MKKTLINIYIYIEESTRHLYKDSNFDLLMQLNNDKYKFNVIYGPSNDDHKFLYENYKFYKDCYNAKNYTFCSDVYRAFKLSKNGGFYSDFGTQINPSNLNDIYNILISIFESNKNTYFMELFGRLWSGFFFSKPNNELLVECLEHFKLFNDSNININYFPGLQQSMSFLYNKVYNSNILPNNCKKKNSSILGTYFENNNNVLIPITNIFCYKSNKKPMIIGGKGRWIRLKYAFYANVQPEMIHNEKMVDEYWNNVFNYYWKNLKEFSNE